MLHLYCSFQLNIEKWLILWDSCIEGWYHCIGIWIADNNIEEESITASYKLKERIMSDITM